MADFSEDIAAAPILVTTVIARHYIDDVSTAPIRVQSQFGATNTPYVFVTDYLNDRVNVYDWWGTYLFQFGGTGSGDGQFNGPWGVATNGANVFVTDTGNHRVQVFTMDGTYVGQFGTLGADVGQLNAPKGIAVDDNGIWVVDSGNNRFQVFEHLTYDPIFVYGSYGSAWDQFDAPTDAWLDGVYFAINDEGNQRIQYFPIFLFAPTSYAVPEDGEATSEMEFPPLELAGNSLAGMPSAAALVLPAFTAGGQGQLTGLNITADLVVAPFTMSGISYIGNVAVGDLALPVFTIDGTTLSDGSVTAALSLPPFELLGFGAMSPAASTYQGVVTNVKTKAISEYDGYDFNSFAVIGGVLYGANDNGLFPLVGDDDNGTPIDAAAATGTLGLRQDIIRRLIEAYLWWRSMGDAVVRVKENEDDNDISDYDVRDESDKMHETRVKFAAGHRGEVVSFEFANVGGADFDLAALKIRTEQLFDRKR